MTGFNVHPPTLHKAAAGAEKINDNVTSSMDKLKGATPAAVAAHEGWAASGGLQQCLTVWEDRLVAFSGEVMEMSAALHHTADDYLETDEKVAEMFRRLAHDLD